MINRDYASVEAWFPTEELEVNLRYPSLVILKRGYGDRFDEDGGRFTESFYFNLNERCEPVVIRTAIAHLDKEVERIEQDIKAEIEELEAKGA